MKKIIFLTFLALSLAITLPLKADQTDRPAVIVGTNGVIEVVIEDRIAARLELPEPPREVLMGPKNDIYLLFNGDSEKGIEASLAVVNPDFKRVFQIAGFKAPVLNYRLSNDQQTFWILTGGEASELVRVDLGSKQVQSYELRSAGKSLELSDDGEWMAVVFSDRDEAGVDLYRTRTMERRGRFDLGQCPNEVRFKDDASTLMAVTYMPAGLHLIKLKSLERQSIELGGYIDKLTWLEKEDLVLAVADGMIYGFDFSGLRFKTDERFYPTVMDKQPNIQKVFLRKGRVVGVLETQSGGIKTGLLQENYPDYCLDENRPLAYFFDLKGERLLVLDMEDMVLEKEVEVGRSLMKALNGLARPMLVSKGEWYKVKLKMGAMVGCHGKLYVLNNASNDVTVYDTKTERISKYVKGIPDWTQYLLVTPDEKYVIAASTADWYFINAGTDEIDFVAKLKWTVPRGDSLQVPYFSPGGERLYISNGSKIAVIDLKNGKRLGNISTKADNAVVVW